MASGWNLLVWLECIGVVSGCCCKEVLYIDILIIIITFPSPLVLTLFGDYFFVNFSNVFSFWYNNLYTGFAFIE